MKNKEFLKEIENFSDKLVSDYKKGRTRIDYTKNEFEKLKKIAVNNKKVLSGYPADLMRKEAVLLELKRLRINGSVIDLGCGPGNFTIELLKKGYKAVGLDISKDFISDARLEIKKVLPKCVPQNTFIVGDMTKLEFSNKFDVAVAMGSLEYTDNIDGFFKSISEIVKKGGYVFLECRNKLFNVFSSNEYTLSSCSDGSLKKLISELDNIGEYSLINDKNILEIQNILSRKISMLLSEIKIPKPKAQNFFFLTSLTKKKQFTPLEIGKFAEKSGFKLENVVYQHIHLFPPKYRNIFPEISDKISILMTPLGYTSIGAWSGSSFIAILKKN